MQTRAQSVVTGGTKPVVIGPWNDTLADAEGLVERGTRSALLKHTTLRLNADIVQDHLDAWTEEDMRARTTELTRTLLSI